jgi:hypothetical protein
MGRYQVGAGSIKDEAEAKPVKRAKPARVRKADPKGETPIERIDPERLSRAIRYLNERPKR